MTDETKTIQDIAVDLAKAWSEHLGTKAVIPGPDIIEVRYRGEQWDKILRLRRELRDKLEDER